MTPAGSQTTPATDMPRTCSICGQRILTSKQPFQHHVDHINHTNQAFHIACIGRPMSIEETEPIVEPVPDPDPEPEPDEPDEDE
jgi:hypothetical protein